MTAWVRSPTPSVVTMRLAWGWTVSSLTKSCRASAALESPRAMWCLTSTRAGTGLEQRGPGGDGRRLSLEGFGQPAGDDGASSVSPPTAAINSAGLMLTTQVRLIVLRQVDDRGSTLEVARPHVGDQRRAARLEVVPV